MAEPASPGRRGTAVVLCLLQRGPASRREVLLGYKLRGFGHGNYVLPGGKLEPGEGAAAAAARELEEETGLVAEPSSLRDIATIRFVFPARSASNMYCTVFGAGEFTRTLQRTEELVPAWHPVDRLPTGQMWEDSPHWLVPLLQGSALDAEVVLAEDNLALASYSSTLRP